MVKELTIAAEVSMAHNGNDIPRWIEAYLEGDEQAFIQLWDAVKRDLWAYLIHHVGQRQDAEDLLQEICIKVYRNLTRLKDMNRFRSWLFAIAVNAVRSHFRRKPMSSLEEIGTGGQSAEVDLVGKGQGQEEAVSVRERFDMLGRCLQRLPKRDREVLILATMSGLPQQDIADQCNMNLNTVKTIIRRAKIKLARFMTEVEYGL